MLDYLKVGTKKFLYANIDVLIFQLILYSPCLKKPGRVNLRYQETGQYAVICTLYMGLVEKSIMYKYNEMKVANIQEFKNAEVDYESFRFLSLWVTNSYLVVLNTSHI